MTLSPFSTPTDFGVHTSVGGLSHTSCVPVVSAPQPPRSLSFDSPSFSHSSSDPPSRSPWTLRGSPSCRLLDPHPNPVVTHPTTVPPRRTAVLTVEREESRGTDVVVILGTVYQILGGDVTGTTPVPTRTSRDGGSGRRSDRVRSTDL